MTVLIYCSLLFNMVSSDNKLFRDNHKFYTYYLSINPLT